jgi:hypothetical protein
MNCRKPLVNGALAAVVMLLLGACETRPPAQEAPADPPTVVPALSLAERDLLPENIAFDPVEGAFYVGSTRHGKIVKVDAGGRATDFAGPRQDGLWMVMGMKVDPARRHLWVASSDGDNLADYEPRAGRAAGLFQYDLESATLIRKWTLEQPGTTHFFNDLVVTPAGNVYATHMFGKPEIWVLDAATGTLTMFARPGGLRAPNGIALGDSGTLYVAHREGLSAFDPTTAERTLLSLPEGASFSPIDGLYFHRGTLLGVHPEEGLIRRFTLDAEGRAVTAIETLVQNHPAATGLTTGVVVGDDFYFVADSQFDRLVNGALPDAAELDDVAILKLALD